MLENAYLDSTSSSDSYVLSDASFEFFLHNNLRYANVDEPPGNTAVFLGGFALSSSATDHSTITVLVADTVEIDVQAASESTQTASGALKQLGTRFSPQPRENDRLKLFSSLRPVNSPRDLPEKFSNGAPSFPKCHRPDCGERLVVNTYREHFMVPKCSSNSFWNIQK